MANASCRDAFARALTQRNSIPFPSGVFKLREAERQLADIEQTLVKIESLARGPRQRTPLLLGSCTTSDKAAWLKGLPRQIAELHGDLIVPAVEALTTDGLSRRALDELSRTLAEKTATIIAKCDDAHHAVRQSVAVEYAAMRAGRSIMRDLVAESLALVRSALATATAPPPENGFS